jgi:hypothetical protein
METLFLIYDEAFEDQVRAIIERGMVIPRYTRIDNVIGARSVVQEAETGYRADRRNRMIIAVAESETIYLMVEELRALRHREGHGLRAFVVPAKEVI